MNIKLQQAIQSGEELRKQQLENVKLAAEKEKVKEREAYERQVQAYREKMMKDDFLFNEIKKAVANGENNLVLDGNYTIAIVEAIEKGDFGIKKVSFSTGSGHIYSDDVISDWTKTTVHWK